MRNRKHYDLNTLREAWNDPDEALAFWDCIANVGVWLVIVMVLAMIVTAL